MAPIATVTMDLTIKREGKPLMILFLWRASSIKSNTVRQSHLGQHAALGSYADDQKVSGQWQQQLAPGIIATCKWQQTQSSPWSVKSFPMVKLMLHPKLVLCLADNTQATDPAYCSAIW